MITVFVTARRLAPAAPMAAAAALLLAACGPPGGPAASASSSGPPSASATGMAGPSSHPPAAASPSGPSGATGSPTGGTALAACATSALSVTLDTSQGEGAAGSSYAPIDFRNTSGQSCSMYGFPGVSFVTGRGGSEIGAAAARDPQFGSVLVTLTPGGIAHAWLQVVVAGNYPSDVCEPVTANWLRIYPPANRVPAYVSHSFPACSSPKASILSVMPVRAGLVARGTVP